MSCTALRHLNKLLCLLLCAVFLGLLCMGVWAQPETGCRLVIDYHHEGHAIPEATFRLYRIADLSGEEELSYIGAFSNLSLDAEALSNEALNLYTRVENQGILPEYTMITDSQGMASVDSVAPGAFLLVGDPVRFNGFTYHVDKQVIFLKGETLTLHTKSTRLPEDMMLISVKTVKLWDDAGYENERPRAIGVRLLKDGKTVSSVVLSEANNWTYTWNGLLPNARWTVEEDVPEDYTVSVLEADHVFTLINHRKQIPQTGHIWWPVLTVLCLGLALIVAGLVIRRGGRNEA